MNQSSRLLISPDMDVHPIADGVLVTEIDGYHVVESDLASAILAAVLNGATTQRAVAETVAGRMPAEEIDQVVSFLVRDGFLLEIEPGVSEDTFIRWSRLPWPVQTIRDALRRNPVWVASLEDDSEPLISHLDAYGIRTDDSSPALDIVLAADIRDDRLAAVNRSMLERRAPWMAAVVEPHAAMATLFVPGKTACWRCLRTALDANVPAPARRSRKAAGRPMPVPAEFYERVARWALHWLVEETAQEIEGSLWVRRPAESPARHPVRRLHGCAACGCDTAIDAEAFTAPARERQGDPDPFESVLDDDGRRRLSTAGAFARASHLISPMTGVIRSLCPLPPVDERLGFVCAAQHPIARPEMDLTSLRLNTQARSMGKGRTPDAARVSALYEGVERYSGIFRDRIPTICYRWDELPGRGLHPHAMMGFSERQYATRDVSNQAIRHAMLRVPRPYDESTPIEWVAGRSLTRNEPCFAPAALAFYDHPDAAIGYALADSNGCAAGERMADAILTGLFEIVERDAAAIWWYNRLARPAVALESFDDPWIRRQAGVHRELGRSLWVLDLTLDLGVPVVAAVSQSHSDIHDRAMGFGCHWEVERAVSSALLEVNQVLTVRRAQSTPAPIFDVPLSEACAKAFLSPAADRPPLECDDYERYEEENQPAIRDLLKRLEQAGLEAIVVDQTHPDIGVPVVRVIAPGAAHHWRRLGADRLYTVPVEMGLLANPHEEAGLNSVSMIL